MKERKFRCLMVFAVIAVFAAFYTTCYLSALKKVENSKSITKEVWGIGTIEHYGIMLHIDSKELHDAIVASGAKHKV